MAIRTYKVTLDSKNTIAPEPVFLRQGDKTGAVVIDATLMDNGTPVSLSGLTPMFKANTADGQAVIADSTGFNIVNASGGEFTYQVPNALSSVPGKIKVAYFSFLDSAGSQSTFNVVFVVEKAADMTHESAKDWVSTLSEIIEQYNQWVNNAHSSWQDFVNENKEIIESIDPGGTLLTEVIDARDGEASLLVKEQKQDADIKKAIDGNNLLKKNIFNRQPLSEKIGVHAYSDSIIENNEQNDNNSFKIIRDLGFKHVRFGLTWSWIEKEKGVYDFSYQDKLVNAALDCGLIPMMSPQGDESVPYQSYEEKKEAIIPFILASVKHYAGKGVIWEGWNEANYGNSWLGQSGKSSKDIILDWTAFNKKMGEIVRDNDPNSIFLAGSLNAQMEVGVDKDMFWEWGPVVEYSLKNGLSANANAISFHPYTMNSQPELLMDVNSKNKAFGQMRALVSKNSNRDLPLAVTEFGYSTTLKSSVTVTEEMQARWATRSMFVLDMLNVPIITLFQYKDNAGGEIQGNVEDGFGFVHGDMKTIKPSGVLFKSIINQLQGYTFFERVSTLTDNDYVLRYVLENKQKLVYWHMDAETNHTISVDGQTLAITNTAQVSAELEFNQSTPISHVDNSDLRKLETQGQFGETYVRVSQIDTLATMLTPGFYTIGTRPSDFPALPEDDYFLKVEGAQTLRKSLKQTLIGTTNNVEYYRTRKYDGSFSNWESLSGIVERDDTLKPNLGDGKLGLRVDRFPHAKLVSVSINFREVPKGVNGVFGTGLPVPMHATGIGVPLQFDVANTVDKTRYRTFNVDLDGRLTSNFATQALGSGEEIIGLYQYWAKR